jgi:LysR family transcriptional regulator (chromosome initiation inhibitor)
LKLNTAQLSAYAAIIREGSFEAAARKLHVTASAISQRLKQLEDNLGQVLLIRGAPCRVTRAGQDLLRHTLQVELLEKELLRQMGMDEPETQVPIRLPIAINADSLDGWFVDAFEKTCRQACITLDIRVDDQDHSASLLRGGEVIGAVSASPVATQGCSVEYLGSMRYFALATPGFCADHFSSGVNASTLGQAPMLVYNAKDRMQLTFIETLTSEKVEPPSHFIPSTPSFVRIARQGLGWGMIPEHMARPHLDAGELVEIVPDRYFDIKLYWHRWQICSPTLEILSESIRTAAAPHLHKQASIDS